MKHKYFTGKNSINKLYNILLGQRPKKIFLVTGNASFIESGAKAMLEDILQDFDYVRFSNYSPNPKIEEAIAGANLFKKEKCDLIIAIGGGSAMDVGKLVNVFSSHSEDPYFIAKNNNEIKEKLFPLIAIPTTSGTGSEATHFAVVYIDKTKHSVAHRSILPDFAFVMPELTYSLSPYNTAVTGADALCQAIESYWSVNSTKESKKYAKEAIKLLVNNIEASVNNPSPENRKAMAIGAYLAGKAINISKTTGPHALSYFLTSEYGIPHGHSVAIFLPLIFKYNLEVKMDDANKLKLKDLSDIVSFLNFSSTENFIFEFSELMDKINLNIKLTSFSFYNQTLLSDLLDSTNTERFANNPRGFNKSILKEIIEQNG